MHTHPPAHSYRASHTDNRRGMLLGFTRVYAAFDGLSTESGRSQARSEAFHTRGGKAIPQTLFRSKSTRLLTPDHLKTLGMVMGSKRALFLRDARVRVWIK